MGKTILFARLLPLLLAPLLGFGLSRAARTAWAYEDPTALFEMWVSREFIDVSGAAGGRLTLQSGTPISTADQAARSTLYYTPYMGARVALYDGTRWYLHALTERSLALSSLTSGANYDVFLYNNSGTLTLELSAAWTNDTTRADALTLQDGIYVKSGATTRRYLGTIRTSATNTTEDTETKRFVWNYYNRVKRKLKTIDTTNTWTYASTTWRSANNSATNRVEYVVGATESPVYLFNGSAVFNNAGTGTRCWVSIGVDSTTAPGADLYTSAGTISSSLPTNSYYFGIPGLGYHFLQRLERGDASGTCTFYGDNGETQLQSGALGYVWG